MTTSTSDMERRIVIVAGMPRAATTFLYHTLAGHPGAWVPPRKELEYFSLNHARGPDWYMGFFEGARQDQVGFDISPIYFMTPGVARRIHEFDSGAKVVLLVRDPVEFVLSFFANRRGATREELSFPEFLRGHTYEKDGKTVDFVFEDGRIRDTIEEFRSTFGQRLLLCSYDLIRRDPLCAVQAIEAFCGLSPHFEADNFENVRINASDQRNIVWLNRLMHTKWFVDLVVRLVPKRLILRARYWVQTRRSEAAGSDLNRDDADRALAEAQLKTDRGYVQGLFTDSPLLLGDGEPYVADARYGI